MGNDHAEHVAELRAELESAKSRLCTHGVPNTNCTEPHDNSDPVNDSREERP